MTSNNPESRGRGNGVSRRHFMRIGGLGLAAAGLARPAWAQDKKIKVAAIFATPIEEPWDHQVHEALLRAAKELDVDYKFSEKVQAAEKSDVETALAEAKKTLEGSPSAQELKNAHEKLTAASHKLAEAMYKATAAAPGEPAATAAPEPGSGGADAKKEGEVIDAEYVDVDEKK